MGRASIGSRFFAYSDDCELSLERRLEWHTSGKSLMAVRGCRQVDELQNILAGHLKGIAVENVWKAILAYPNGNGSQIWQGGRYGHNPGQIE